MRWSALPMKFYYTAALLASLVFAPPVQAVSLSSLLSPGQTISLGDKVFTNFQYSVPWGSTFEAASDVDVTVSLSDGRIALQFGISGNATPVSYPCGFFRCYEPAYSTATIEFDTFVVGSTDLIDAVGMEAGLSTYAFSPSTAYASLTATFSDIGSSAILGADTLYTSGTTYITPLTSMVALDPTTQALHTSATADLSATPGSSIASMSSAYLSGVTFTFDQVTPVPEPETYAMLLAGLALLGVAGRRNRRRHNQRQLRAGARTRIATLGGHHE
jgi:hypothetical protein